MTTRKFGAILSLLAMIAIATVCKSAPALQSALAQPAVAQATPCYPPELCDSQVYLPLIITTWPPYMPPPAGFVDDIDISPGNGSMHTIFILPGSNAIGNLNVAIEGTGWFDPHPSDWVGDHYYQWAAWTSDVLDSQSRPIAGHWDLNVSTNPCLSAWKCYTVDVHHDSNVVVQMWGEGFSYELPLRHETADCVSDVRLWSIGGQQQEDHITNNSCNLLGVWVDLGFDPITGFEGHWTQIDAYNAWAEILDGETVKIYSTPGEPCEDTRIYQVDPTTGQRIAGGFQYRSKCSDGPPPPPPE